MRFVTPQKNNWDSETVTGNENLVWIYSCKLASYTIDWFQTWRYQSLLKAQIGAKSHSFGGQKQTKTLSFDKISATFCTQKLFKKNSLNTLFGGVFVVKWLRSTQKVRVNGQKLPLWTNIRTLLEPTSVTTRRLQVYPRESTKTPPTYSLWNNAVVLPFLHRCFDETTALF